MYIYLVMLYDKKVYIYIYFFCHQIQTHIDSVNQTGNFASMWTTKDVCFLALRARLSALEFSVRGTWMISELQKLSFKNFISSRYTSNADHSSGSETIFTSWEQSVANMTWNWCRFLIHSITHINASISARGDKDALTFIAPIRPSKPSRVLY